MGVPGRPHCLGWGCKGTPVGAAHSIRPRWEAMWPGSKPGTTGSPWDRLGDLVLSTPALPSLKPRAPGTHMAAGDCLVADGRTAIVNVNLFAGHPWAQIQPPPNTHTSPKPLRSAAHFRPHLPPRGSAAALRLAPEGRMELGPLTPKVAFFTCPSPSQPQWSRTQQWRQVWAPPLRPPSSGL